MESMRGNVTIYKQVCGGETPGLNSTTDNGIIVIRLNRSAPQIPRKHHFKSTTITLQKQGEHIQTVKLQHM